MAARRHTRLHAVDCKPIWHKALLLAEGWVRALFTAWLAFWTLFVWFNGLMDLLFRGMFGCFTHCVVDCLAGWLVGWLAGTCLGFRYQVSGILNKSKIR